MGNSFGTFMKIGNIYVKRSEVRSYRYSNPDEDKWITATIVFTNDKEEKHFFKKRDWFNTCMCRN